MKTMSLHREEIEELYELIQKFDEQEWVTLNRDDGSGIGYILTATFNVEHNGLKGDFTKTITSVENW